MLETLLKELGFSEKEAQVYLEVVRSSPVSAHEIAKKTKLHRPTVYDMVRVLQDKGLITQIVYRGKKAFQPCDLQVLLSKLREKQDLTLLAMKELEKIRAVSSSSFQVEVFEGKEGLKSYFSDIEVLLKKGELKDYLVYGSTLDSIKQISFFLLSRIRNVLDLAKKVDFRVIWSSEVKYGAFQKFFTMTGKHKFLPKEVKCSGTTVVYNDYFVLLYMQEKPVVVRIHSKEVAATYRNTFAFIWKQL